MEAYNLKKITKWLKDNNYVGKYNYLNSGVHDYCFYNVGIRVHVHLNYYLSIQTNPNIAGNAFCEIALVQCDFDATNKATHRDVSQKLLNKLGYKCDTTLRFFSKKKLFAYLTNFFLNFKSVIELESKINNVDKDDDDYDVYNDYNDYNEWR